MANDLRKEQHATADSFETHSPSADYGLNSDHGFDPTKYDFYNPSTQTAGKAFVVTLDQSVVPQLSSHPNFRSPSAGSKAFLMAPQTALGQSILTSMNLIHPPLCRQSRN